MLDEFNLKANGFWFIKSNSDARWNASGHSIDSTAIGALKACAEARATLSTNLGAPPNDLDWGWRGR